MWTNRTIHYATSDAVKWKILAVPKIPRVEKVAHFEINYESCCILSGPPCIIVIAIIWFQSPVAWSPYFFIYDHTHLLSPRFPCICLHQNRFQSRYRYFSIIVKIYFWIEESIFMPKFLDIVGMSGSLGLWKYELGWKRGYILNFKLSPEYSILSRFIISLYRFLPNMECITKNMLSAIVSRRSSWL